VVHILPVLSWICRVTPKPASEVMAGAGAITAPASLGEEYEMLM
jgi:hypothetical protein